MRRTAIGGPPPGGNWRNDPLLSWVVDALLQIQTASHDETADQLAAEFDADLAAVLAAVAAGYQPLDATLTTIAALTGAANKGLYFTGADTAALYDLTAAGLALLDDANAAAQLTTLGVTSFAQTLLDDANAAAVLTTLGVTSFVQTLLDDADAVAARSTLGLAWELIEKGTTGSVTSKDFTNLSAYRMLRLSIRGVVITDNANLGLRTSTDNGSSFAGGATDYAVQFLHAKAATVTASGANSDFMNLNAVNGIGNAANEYYASTIHFFDFNQASECTFDSTTVFIDTGTAFNRTWNAGRRASTTARDALRIIASSGNINTHYCLEGVRG